MKKLILSIGLMSLATSMNAQDQAESFAPFAAASLSLSARSELGKAQVMNLSGLARVADYRLALGVSYSSSDSRSVSSRELEVKALVVGRIYDLSPFGLASPMFGVTAGTFDSTLSSSNFYYSNIETDDHQKFVTPTFGVLHHIGILATDILVSKTMFSSIQTQSSAAISITAPVIDLDYGSVIVGVVASSTKLEFKDGQGSSRRLSGLMLGFRR